MPLPEMTDLAESSPARDDASALARDVRRAVIWRSGSQIAAQIISWTSTLIVVRLLAPADYGLFAMSLVMLSFLTFLNGYGFASALIQAESVGKERIRQAFGMLLVANGALAAIQLIAAPWVAAYFGQPVIADMLRVQALIYLSTPFIAIPEAMMGRALDFRTQAIVNLTSAAVGAAVSLGMAYQGYGVWTLVIAPIIMFWTRAIGLTWQSRLLVRPSFDFTGCGPIFRFGLIILATQMFWIVQTQTDIFFIGARFDAHDVGLYSQAAFLATLFYARFVPPLNEVAFPAYARLQKDPAALRWAFLRAARLIMLLAAPLYAGMAATAQPLVATLFGPTWHELPPLVEAMALAMPFMTLQILFAPALNALGKPHIPLRAAIAGALIFGLAFFVSSRFGVAQMALIWLAAAPLLLIATVQLSRPHIGIDLKDLARAVAAPVGCAVLMGAGVLVIDRLLLRGALDTLPLLHLGLLITAGVAIYAAMLHFADRGALPDVWRLIRRKPPAAQPSVS